MDLWNAFHQPHRRRVQRLSLGPWPRALPFLSAMGGRRAGDTVLDL